MTIFGSGRRDANRASTPPAATVTCISPRRSYSDLTQDPIAAECRSRSAVRVYDTAFYDKLPSMRTEDPTAPSIGT